MRKYMKKAVFLDRDGTLNIDHGYVHKIDDFQFIEGSIDALKALKVFIIVLIIQKGKANIKKTVNAENQNQVCY